MNHSRRRHAEEGNSDALTSPNLGQFYGGNSLNITNRPNPSHSKKRPLEEEHTSQSRKKHCDESYNALHSNIIGFGQTYDDESDGQGRLGRERSSSLSAGSSFGSPTSLYSAGSFDNLTGAMMADSPTKPNYSHSSSSQKFQDYNKSDEEDQQGSPGLCSGSSSVYSTGSVIPSSSSSSSAYGSANSGERNSLGYFSEASANDGSNHDVIIDEEKDLTDGPSYSSAAKKMMSAMGYKPGKGLGATGDGRLEPIEASEQRGRRGLGHSTPMLKRVAGSKTWDFDSEPIVVKEVVEWLPSCPKATPPSLPTLTEWVEDGPPKLDISDETTYCDPELLREVLLAKTVFDELGQREIQRARQRSNPFETIGKLFFQNRAALKMANLDAITDMMFTNPKDERGHSTIIENEVLYFADVCAAPGGFAEYAIWRRKKLSEGFPDVHGFGFTLRSNDFKLQDFYAAPREFFEPHYGEGGENGDGDIYKPANILQFCTHVKAATQGRGVHFMMADGGFSVDGQENIQEILSKQLYLAQFTVALGIVREGGHFVCKLFDTFTLFSVGLIYLMYRCFRYVAIHKPNTSRPANSERYIICKWLRPGCECVYDYLFEINEMLESYKPGGGEEKRDVMQVAPHEVMAADEVFIEYIKNMNNSIGKNQIIGLRKIQVFCENPSLMETRQCDLRLASLREWQVPDNPRLAPVRGQPIQRVNKIMRDQGVGAVPPSVTELFTPECLSNHIRSAFNYRFVVTSSAHVPSSSAGGRGGCKADRAFYIGLGGRNVFRAASLTPNTTWDPFQPRPGLLELPPDTLIYAELVHEIHGMSPLRPSPGGEKAELRKQSRMWALHIIDAICLNGFDVSSMHLFDRHKHVGRFCRAFNKTSRSDLLPLRCKQLYRLEEIHHILCNPGLSVRQLKSGDVSRVLHPDPFDGPDYHVPATGVLLIPSVTAHYMVAYSRSTKRKYYYNTLTHASEFETPRDSFANFSTTYSGSLLWTWPAGTVVLGNDRRVGAEYSDSDSDGDESQGGGGLVYGATKKKKRRPQLHLEQFVEFVNAPSSLGQRPQQQQQQPQQQQQQHHQQQQQQHRPLP